MNVIQVKCPNCAARLAVAAGADSVDCEYCHTRSAVQRRSRMFQIPVKVPDAGHVARQTINRAIVAIVIVSTVGFLALMAFFIWRANRQADASAEAHRKRVHDAINQSVNEQLGKAQAIFGDKVVIRTPGEPSGGRMEWLGLGQTIVADVDGDKVVDAVGRVRYSADGARCHIAAFSGTTGRKIWESPTLGSYTETYQGRLALLGDLLLFADPGGSITAYRTSDGTRVWAAEIGERTERMCRAGDDVLLEAADHRWHKIARATGARTDGTAIKTCAALPNDDEKGDAAVTRENGYHIKVEGVHMREIFRRGDGATFGIGYRSPGTAVPILVRVEGKGAAWKVEVPATNPLDVSHPSVFTATEDRACVVYEPGAGAPRLTCFDAGGSRQWDAEIAKGTTIVLRGLTAAGDKLFLSSWGHLQVFDLATGRRLHVIGDL